MKTGIIKHLADGNEVAAIQALNDSDNLEIDFVGEALALAIKKGFGNLAEKLLEKGALPDLVAVGQRWNGVHLAIEYHEKEILRSMVSIGADVNCRDKDGLTPLHHAVDVEADYAHQHGIEPVPSLTSILLKAGADHTAKDQDGKSVSEFAIEYGYEALIKLLQNENTPPN